jgi:hypothetical protein
MQILPARPQGLCQTLSVIGSATLLKEPPPLSFIIRDLGKFPEHQRDCGDLRIKIAYRHSDHLHSWTPLLCRVTQSRYESRITRRIASKLPRKTTAFNMTLEKKEGLDSHELKPPSPRAGPSDQNPEAAAGNTSPDEQPTQQLSAFKGLGLLDRFLALWILLAMAISIILGNFVPETGPTLQKGKFVGVSVPIGMFPRRLELLIVETDTCASYRFTRHDVSHPLQSAI